MDICTLLQNRAHSIGINLRHLFPTLYVVREFTPRVPNLCNEDCEHSLKRFIDTGKLIATTRCSDQNPPQTRLRDGFLEHSCYWARVYNAVAHAPQELERH